MTRDERLRHEATARECERLRAWLGRISWRARGMGRGLAMQAIYSKRWPDEAPTRSKTMGQRNYNIADTEERELSFLIDTKKTAVRSLALVAETRKARGEEHDIGIGEAIELEETILRGYELALANRRTELKGGR